MALQRPAVQDRVEDLRARIYTDLVDPSIKRAKKILEHGKSDSAAASVIGTVWKGAGLFQAAPEQREKETHEMSFDELQAVANHRVLNPTVTDLVPISDETPKDMPNDDIFA